MKKEELRKVSFTVRAYRGEEKKTGYFHQWGLTNESANNDTYYNVTCGIVEDEQGNIYTPYPANIKFLSPIKED